MRWQRAAQVALLLAMVVLPGCSGSEDEGNQVASVDDQLVEPTATSDAEEPSEDPEERALQFAECLRDHGIEVPDPGGAGLAQALRALDAETREAAFEACGEYATSEVDQEMSEEVKQWRVDFFECLRDHGIDVDDPDPNSFGPSQETWEKLFENPDEETEAAIEKCEGEGEISGRSIR